MQVLVKVHGYVCKLTVDDVSVDVLCGGELANGAKTFLAIPNSGTFNCICSAHVVASALPPAFPGVYEAHHLKHKWLSPLASGIFVVARISSVRVDDVHFI